MGTYDQLVQTIKKSGEDVEFFGPQKQASISELANALGVSLPPSYAGFLETLGGGGVTGSAGISGIYNNEPLRMNQGCVYGDTIRTRTQDGLPPTGIVVLRDYDVNAVYCIDMSHPNENGEGAVWTYDIAKKKYTKKLANTFGDFFETYLRNRTRK
jgi:hypothetical protein